MLKSEIVKGQKSWLIENDNIKLYLTEFAGHMAPVTFFKDSENPVEPFYINPWAEEALDMSGQPGVLLPLRGDFFCLPFGGDNNWKGEHHPPHGDVQEKVWKLDDVRRTGKDVTAVFSVETVARKGRVVKTVNLKDGENNIYTNDSIEGFTGPRNTRGIMPTFHGNSPETPQHGALLKAGFHQ